MRWIDWLWMTRGTLRLGEGATDEVVLDRVAWLLEKRAWKTVTRGGAHSLRFRDDSGFFSPNWLPLAWIERGRVWIDQNAGEPVLRYELRHLHVFVAWTVMLSVYVAVTAATGAPGLGVRHGLIGAGAIVAVSLFSLTGAPPLLVRAADPRFPIKLA